MRVLETVEQHRRRKRRVLAITLVLSLGALASAAGWWLIRPGRAVHEVLGVAVPDGCRQLHEERAGEEDAPHFRAVYLSSTWPVEDVEALFEPLAVERRQDSRRYLLEDGTEVFVAPPRDVPATRMSPIQPVSDGVPLGTRSWIVISHGTPPASTWTVSVPPVGES